jgi:soluble lytic murein transglycosylase-like protein
MSYLAMILRHIELVMRLQAAVPSLDLGAAYAHIAAAESAATDQVPVELLLGIAFVESRFDPTAVSRVEGTTRRVGRYPSTQAPARLNRRASLYCGPLQTFAPSWSRCMAMRDLRTAYAAGVAELSGWLRDRRVKGDVARALAGHGCGNFGIRTRSCNGYPGRVLWMERQFRLGTDRPSTDRTATRRVVASS